MAVVTCFVMCECVYVWVGFVMCGCFGNMCTCIYCVLYCLYCVIVLFGLCILFVLSVLLPPNENSIAVNNNNNNNNNTISANHDRSLSYSTEDVK